MSESINKFSLNSNTIQLIHIALEVVVIATVAFYFNGKISTIRLENMKLRQELDEMKGVINKQNQILGNIMQRLGDVRPPRPNKRPSRHTKKNKRRPPPPQNKKSKKNKRYEASTSSEGFDDDDLDRELEDELEETLESLTDYDESDESEVEVDI